MEEQQVQTRNLTANQIMYVRRDEISVTETAKQRYIGVTNLYNDIALCIYDPQSQVAGVARISFHFQRNRIVQMPPYFEIDLRNGRVRPKGSSSHSEINKINEKIRQFAYRLSNNNHFRAGQNYQCFGFNIHSNSYATLERTLGNNKIEYKRNTEFVFDTQTGLFIPY